MLVLGNFGKGLMGVLFFVGVIVVFLGATIEQQGGIEGGSFFEEMRKTHPGEALNVAQDVLSEDCVKTRVNGRQKFAVVNIAQSVITDEGVVALIQFCSQAFVVNLAQCCISKDNIERLKKAFSVVNVAQCGDQLEIKMFQQL